MNCCNRCSEGIRDSSSATPSIAAPNAMWLWLLREKGVQSWVEAGAPPDVKVGTGVAGRES